LIKWFLITLSNSNYSRKNFKIQEIEAILLLIFYFIADKLLVKPEWIMGRFKRESDSIYFPVLCILKHNVGRKHLVKDFSLEFS
jgi:hypothetical protein